MLLNLAAFEHLLAKGAFDNAHHSKEQLESWLKEPISIGQKQVNYRFASQKAGFLAESLPLAATAPAFDTGRELRRWLMNLPGVGPKTASWIARNWMNADDVAILDIHILRVGQVVGLFPMELSLPRDYEHLERQFIRFSAALDVCTSELDAVIWQEMSIARSSVREIVRYLNSQRRSDESKTNTRKQTLRKKSSAYA